MCEIGEKCERSTTLCIDNQSAINLIQNPSYHRRTKHIDVIYHYVREKYESKEISLQFVPTHDQLADIFTKPLPRDNFQTIRELMGLKN